MLRARVLRLCSVSDLAASVLGPYTQLSKCGSALACALSGNLQFPRHLSSETGGEEQREVTNPRVLELSEQILQLNLLEVSDLTELLRKRLNIQAPVFGASLGAGLAPAGALQAASAEAPATAPAEEKTEFTVKLEGFDAASKIKVIKEVRAITDLGLKEAKDLVESSPAVLKKNVTKEDAEQIKAKLEASGAKVALE